MQMALDIGQHLKREDPRASSAALREGELMGALSFRSPTDTEQYRDSTATHRAMAGVTGPSFRCVKCRQVRATKGRREAVKGYRRAGYHCRECAQ